MADLSTEYLGLQLPSPLVVSSNPLTRTAGSIRQLEDYGAGAVILPSLFEEQITLQEHVTDAEHRDDEKLPPSLQHLPSMTGYNRGVDGYLMQIYEAKNAVDIPVIASLNGTSTGGWVAYSRLLASAGADAMELNIYYIPTSPESTGSEIEERFVHLVREVKASVPIPVSVKLNPCFSSIPHMAAQLAAAGADGLVLFNRFYQPDFDLDTETVVPSLELSDPSELRFRLRWVSILYDHIDADMAITGGVHSGTDAVKAVMAGASTAMLASALLVHGVEHLGTVRSEMSAWMDAHGHAGIGDIKGRMSLGNVAAPAALERANYIEELASYARG